MCVVFTYSVKHFTFPKFTLYDEDTVILFEQWAKRYRFDYYCKQRQFTLYKKVSYSGLGCVLVLWMPFGLMIVRMFRTSYDFTIFCEVFLKIVVCSVFSANEYVAMRKQNDDLALLDAILHFSCKNGDTTNLARQLLVH